MGCGLTARLWDKGVVWGLTIFLAPGGFFLSLSGITGILGARNRGWLEASTEERREELLCDMIGAKKQGKTPIRLLNERGITDGEIRTSLLEELNERLTSGGGKGV